MNHTSFDNWAVIVMTNYIYAYQYKYFSSSVDIFDTINEEIDYWEYLEKN